MKRQLLFPMVALLILALSLPLLASAPGSVGISVMPSQGTIKEDFLIDLIPIPDGELSIRVKSPTQTFRYSGEWDGTLTFSPQEVGEHLLQVYDENGLIGEKTFMVTPVPKTSPPSGTGDTAILLSIDKERLLLGEQVIITGQYPEEVKLFIATPTKELRFMGGGDLPIVYTAEEPGLHRVELREGNSIVKEKTFIVDTPPQPILLPKNSSNQSGEQSHEHEEGTSEDAHSQEATLRPGMKSNSGAEGEKTPDHHTPDSYTPDPYKPKPNTPFTFAEDQEEADPPNPEEPLPVVDIELKDRHAAAYWSQVKIIDEEPLPEQSLLRKMAAAFSPTERQDIELRPANHPVTSMELRGLDTSKTVTIGLDTVPTTAAQLDGKVTQRSFAINLENTDFVDGEARVTAVGTELWKCALWNFDEARCEGSWSKVQNILPGEEYTIALFPGDPGYAETGVATINAKKPIYTPGETAEFFIVALDTAGHLVSGATVNLLITEPDLSTSSRSTDNGSISQVSPGIYQTTFPTSQVGNHTLFVTIQGQGVNSTMVSNFLVQSSFPFALQRETPITTNPFNGSFITSITIDDLQGVGTFDYREILPSSFTLLNAGGGSISFTARGQEILWTGLSDGATISYEVLPPLVTPELYSLSGEVLYGSSQLFTEARPWWLAVDPEAGYSSYESGDIDMCPLGRERFAIGWCQNEADPDDTCRLAVYNTNGTLIDDIDVETSSDIYSRIALGCINATDILVGHVDATPEILQVARFQLQGSTLAQVDGFDTVDSNYADNGEDAFDIGVAITDATYGWLFGTDNQDEDADMNRVTLSNLTLSADIQVDGRTDSDTNWDNNADICAINATRVIACWFDDRNGNFFRARTYDETGTSIVGAHNIDGDIGGDGAISCDCMQDKRVAFGYYSSLDSNIYIRVGDYTGDVATSVIGATSIDSDAGTSERVATAEIKHLGESYFGVIFSDSAAGDIKVGIYDSNGSQVTAPFPVTSSENTNELYRMVDIVGTDSNLGLNVCDNKFVVAYTKNDGQSYWQGFDINGSTWDGSCNLAPAISFEAPTYANDYTPPYNWSEVNVSINNTYEQNINDIWFDWNGTNTSFYNDNLVLMYNFENISSLGEGSSLVVDMSPAQLNNGTINLNPSYGPGRYGNSFNFVGGDPNGGQGETVYADDSASLDITGNITLEAWFRTDTVAPAWQYILIKGSGNDRVYGLNLETNGLRFFLNGYGGADDAVASGVISTDTWYHVVGTYDGSVSRLYLNGVEVANASHTSTITTNAFPLYVSCRGHAPGMRYCFDGEIDEVRVYNTSMSPEAVKYSYDSNLQRLSQNQWALYGNISNNADGVYDYQSCVETDIGDVRCTESRNLTMGADIPFINSLECFVQGASWTNCTDLSYADTIVQMRSECVASGGGEVQNVTFVFQNLEDSKMYWNVTTTTNSSDYWIYDNPDLTLMDSGNFTVDVRCDQGNFLDKQYAWEFPWGTLSSQLIDPNTDVNVVQNWFYNYTVNISCSGGECGEIEAVIDPANWWNTTYSYRRTITITSVGSTLLNFPVYLNLSLQSQMQSDFDDIRFVNGSCGVASTFELDYELANYSSEANVWVEIPSLVVGSNQICMYYGNPSASSASSGPDVWDSDYIGIWHMESTDPSDSTSYGYDGTAQGTINSLPGKIGRANEFPGGTNDYIAMSSPLSEWNGGSELTICTWAWVDTLGTGNADDGMLFSREDGNTAPILFWYNYDGSQTYTLNVGSTGTTGNRVNGANGAAAATTWQYVCGVMNGTNRYLYINGALSNSNTGGTATVPSITDNARLGEWTLNNNYDLDGRIDEMRASQVARSADWINMSYQFMTNQSSFISYGASEQNTKGIIPVDPSLSMAYPIAFMNFESPTDFPQEGQCGTVAANRCAGTSPWDNFTDCQSGNGGYGMCASTEADAGGTGSYGFECRGCDRNDVDNNGGLYINISSTACGGEPCKSIAVSYYQMVQGLNAVGSEGSGVFAVSGGTWYEISSCLDGDPDCDCNEQVGCTRGVMGDYAEFVQKDICEIPGVDCTQEVAIHFTAYYPTVAQGTGDYFGWDEINVTGYPDYVYIHNLTNSSFYTTTMNPADGTSHSCLDGMGAGDSCEITWSVNGTGTLNTTWPFFYYFNPLNYSSVVASDETSTFYVTIKNEIPPIITGTQCFETGSGWIDCTTLSFADTFGAVKTNCTSGQRGTISNVSFLFQNLDDARIYFNVTVTNATGDIFQYDPANFQLLDSGDYNLHIICRENPESEEDYNWTFPYGTLSTMLIDPNESREVGQGSSFTFTSEVTCTGGECGYIQASIDPPGDWWNRSWPYRIEINVTENSGSNLNGYAFNVTLDTASLISAGKMQDNCTDIRVTDYNGSTLLPYMLDSFCNTSTTMVWFNATVNASQNKTFYLYYGRADAPSLSAPDNVFPVFINFTREGVVSYGGTQDVDPTQYQIINDTALQMWGNNWKRTLKTVSSPGDTSSVLEYWFRSDGVEGEVNGIGFDTDDTLSDTTSYRIYGTQTWGVTGDDTYGGSGWELITETLDEFSGSFDRLIYANDADASQATNVTFYNVRIRDQASTLPTISQGAEEAGGKGLIPMNNGTPFWTGTSNPMTSSTTACLASMVDGQACNTSWTVWATGELNSTWPFFVTYESLNYSVNVTTIDTSTVDITIVDYPLPLISNLQCYLQGTGWSTCSDTAYKDNMTQVRAQCTSQSGQPITSMKFTFSNEQDNKTYFSNTTTTENGGFWVADVPDTYILDGGDFTMIARCTENVSVESNASWAIPFGSLTPLLLDPISAANAIQNRTFNFSASVACSGGECGNLTAILDPLNPYSFAFMDFESSSDFPSDGQCATTAAYQCSGTTPWDDFTDCQDGNGPYGMCASTEADAGGTGTRGLECRGCDRNDGDVNGGLYIYVNDTACGTAPCEVINLSYYQVVQSIDNPNEGSAVWVFNNASNLTLVSSCIENDPDCDCDVISGCTRATMGTYAEFVSTDICSLSGVDCSQNLTIWFTSWNTVQHGTGDYFGWDEINLTGFRRKGIVPMNDGEPFYTTNQNPRYSGNLSCLVDLQDGDSCDLWWLVNATGEIGTTWDFFAEFLSESYSLEGISDNTSQVPITIVESTPPNATSVELWPEFPLSSDNLNCSFTVNDIDTFDTLFANVTWYRNSTYYSSSLISVANGVEQSVFLGSGNTSINDRWICQVTPYDLVSNGTPVNSSERTVALTAPPVLEALQCEENGTVWVACSELLYGDTLTRVRANVSDDGFVANVSFIFSNVEDQMIFFNGSTTDNSSGWFLYDNVDLLINDSGTMNISTLMTDDYDYTRDTDTTWFVPFGIMSIVWNTPDSDVNMTQYQVANFSMDLTCTGGECGNFSAILDPYSSFIIAAMDFESPTDFPQEGRCGTAAANQCAATNPWDDFTDCQDGNGYGLCSSTEADAGSTGSHGLECRACDRDDGDNNGGLYIRVNTTGCAGRECEQIYLSYYEVVESMDAANEGSAVYAFDDDSGLVLLSECMDGDPTCDCNSITGCTRASMGDYARHQSMELCSNPSLDCDQNITIWFTSKNAIQHGNGDYFAWDEIYLTGYAPKGVIPMNVGTPFYTTDQNPMLVANTSCLGAMFDGSTCTVQWSVNATGDLNSSHTLFGYTNATQYAAAYNTSHTDNITVKIIDNLAPSVSSILLGPSPAFYQWNLTCNFTIFDSNSFDSLSANVTWYRNGSYYSSEVVGVADGVLESVLLGSGNTSAGETWKCGVTPSDASLSGSQVNSSSVSITANLPPVINEIQCEEDTIGWTNCSNVLYDSDLLRVRTNCSADSGVANATFALYFSNDATSQTVIANMTFDTGSDFYEAALCPNTGVANCTANNPWDDFSACDDSATTGYQCASTEANAVGSRGLECRGCDRGDPDNSGGLTLQINNTACDGEACDSLKISYYQVVESMDNANEGSAVWINDSDGILRAISSCMDGDPDCDCNSIVGCTRASMGSYAEFVEVDLCGISGINCSDNLTIRFTSNNTIDHGNGDYFAWDDILVLGTKAPTPIFNGTTNTIENGYYVFDNSDYTINQSGTYILNVSCTDNDAVTVSDYEDWLVSYGSLSVQLIDPNGDRNVQKDDFFNFTTEVECTAGLCGDAVVTLDPYNYTETYTPVSGFGTTGFVWEIDSNNNPPTSINSRTSLSLENASNMSLNDNQRFETIDPDTGDYVSVEIQTRLNQSIDGLQSLTLSFEGQPQNNANIILYVWNRTYSAWREVATAFLVADTDGTVSGTVVGDLSQIVNSSRDVSWLILHDDTSDLMRIDEVTLTATYQKGLISTVVGTIPFYTTDSNPQNGTDASCLLNMLPGDTCQVTWAVNATGTSGSVHEFFAYVNSSTLGSYVSSGESSHIDITISDANNVPPVVTLVSPPDNQFTNNVSVQFNCSATDNVGLKNMSLYGDFSGSWDLVNSTPVSGLSNSSLYNETLSEGQYLWNCLAYDTDLNYDWGNTNRTLTIDLTGTDVTPNAPTPGSSFPGTTVLLNFTVTDNYDSTLICNLTFDGSQLETNEPIANGSAFTRNVSDLTSGIHYWNVSCIDDAGNQNTSTTWNFTLADAPPSVNLLSPDGISTNNLSVLFFYRPIDNDGLQNATLYLNGIANQTKYTIVNGVINNFTVSNIPEGFYNWTVNATDDGNLSTMPSPFNVTVDRTSPNVTLFFPPEAYNASNGTVPFNFTVIDNLDDLLVCNITVNGTVLDLNFNATNASQTLRNVTVPDGISFWNITCVDDAGNANTSETRSINVTQPPFITLLAPEEGYSQKDSEFIFKYSPSDNTALASCSLYINDIFNRTNTSPLTNGGNESFVVDPVADGRYNWTIVCNDTFGLTGYSETRNFTRDNTPPAVFSYYPYEGDTHLGQSVPFNWTPIDNLDNNLTCNLSVDNVVEGVDISAPNGTITQYNVTGLFEGDHNWSVTCWDGAGNANTSVTKNFTFYQPPTVDLLYPSDGGYVNSSNLTLIYFPNDNDDVVWTGLYLNGVLNQTDSSPTVEENNTFNLTNLADGNYTWLVSAEDTLSLYTNSTEWTFWVDTVPPNLTILTPTEGQIVTWNEFDLNFTISDNLAPSLECNISFNGSVLGENVSVANGSIQSYTETRPDGDYSWTVTCVDLAGWTVNVTTNFTIEAPPLVVLNFPIDGYRTTDVNFSFNYTPYDYYGFENCTLRLDDGYNGTEYAVEQGQPNYLNVTNLNESVHFWTVECIDADLNYYAPPNETFVIDQTGPKIELLNPLEAAVLNNNTIDFAWNATDYPNVTILCDLYVDATLNLSNISGQSMSIWNETVYNLTDGDHNWSVICRDDLNNTGSLLTGNFTINQPDMVTNNSFIWFNETNPDIGENISISLNVSNIGGNPATNVFVVFYDGNPYSGGTMIDNETIPIIGINATQTASVSWLIPEGAHQVWALVDPLDTIGELNESNNNATINISTLVARINSPSNGISFNATTFTLNFTVADYLGGTVNYTIYVNGAPENWSTVLDNVSQTYPITRVDGSYQVFVRAFDSLGRQKDSATITVIIDTTAPTVDFITPNATFFPETNLSIEANITDQFSTNITYQIYLDGIWNRSGNTTDGVFLQLNFTNQSEGIHTLVIQATDELNNTGNSTTLFFYIDLTPPQPAIETQNQTWFNTQTPLINFNITDNLDPTLNYTFFVDGSPDVSGSVTNGTSSSDNLNAMGEGTHLIGLQGSDSANNTDNATPITIYVDVTPPNIQIFSPSDGANLSSQEVFFNFTVTDNMDQLIDCTLFVSGEGSYPINATNNSMISYNLSPVSIGYHEWNVTCVDEATNTNTSLTWSFTIPAPDLVITAGNITFSNSTPIEGQNITVNATIFNVGNSTALNFIVQFWLGDPDFGGVQIGTNQTVASLLSGANTTLMINHTAVIGQNDIYVIVDPPLATNGTVPEEDETNNKDAKGFQVGFYNIFSGTTNNLRRVADSFVVPVYTWNQSDATGSNLFVADLDSSLDFLAFQALGRDTSNNTQFDDFAELDVRLGSTNLTDNVNTTWTAGGVPRLTSGYTLFRQSVQNVPIVNSTNVTAFRTGILWDTSDGGTEFDGTQDVVFHTLINESQLGSRGTYDYEVRVPATLRDYTGATSRVAFYAELK